MSDESADPVEAAHAAWTTAEDAYHRESEKYVSVGWASEGIRFPEEAMTLEAAAKLTRLRGEAQEAQDAFVRAMAGR